MQAMASHSAPRTGCGGRGREKCRPAGRRDVWGIHERRCNDGQAQKPVPCEKFERSDASRLGRVRQSGKADFCREYGIRPGDDWCGLSDLTARKLKSEEVKAWEAQAEADRATLVFIKGMLEIGAKDCAESGRGGR